MYQYSVKLTENEYTRSINGGEKSTAFRRIHGASYENIQYYYLKQEVHDWLISEIGYEKGTIYQIDVALFSEEDRRYYRHMKEDVLYEYLKNSDNLVDQEKVLWTFEYIGNNEIYVKFKRHEDAVKFKCKWT